VTDPANPPAPKKAVDYYGANVIELFRRRSVPVQDPLAAKLKAGIEAIARKMAEYTMRRARETKDRPKGATKLPDEKTIAELIVKLSAQTVELASGLKPLYVEVYSPKTDEALQEIASALNNLAEAIRGNKDL
jgi:hypothetical protein